MHTKLGVIRKELTPCELCGDKSVAIRDGKAVCSACAKSFIPREVKSSGRVCAYSHADKDRE